MNSASGQSDGLNATKNGWYEDCFLFMLDLSEGGLFSDVFVPPPPRPISLNGSVIPGDPTTCERCSWAWKLNKMKTTEATFDIPSKAEWVVSLVIVSMISACLGAAAMLIFFHLRRSKNIVSNETESRVSGERGRRQLAEPVEKEQIETIIPSIVPTENSVWNWLSKKSSSPPQLETITCSPVENHYTQMEETYNNEDTLYTELDMDDGEKKDSRTAKLYQNQAFTDSDSQNCSAPSSAYYSDLSVVTIPDQAYEVVNLSIINVNWDNSGGDSKHSAPTRLAAIKENVSVPSEYV